MTEAIPVTIRNSTFSGNSTSGNGGGVLMGPNAAQTALVQNCTFVGNSAQYGGGANGNSSGGALDSCLLADNTASSAGSAMSYIRFANTVYEGTLYGSTDQGGNDQVECTPAALADNGGPTLTHAIDETSPAYNAGSNPAGLRYDQRGSGFKRTASGGTDCGAYEVQAPPAGTFILIR